MMRRAKLQCFARLLALVLLMLVPPSRSFSFAFDHDTVSDCAERTEDCEKDKIKFFQCPIACAKALEPPDESRRASSGLLHDEAFYELQATDVNGKTIHFENYEGYVTVIAALPRKQGELHFSSYSFFVECSDDSYLLSFITTRNAAVSQFYYEMLEHLHELYPYTLEILVVPLNKGVKIILAENPKVAVLEKSHPVLDLLQSRLHGKLDNADKATLYLISADGNTVEAFVSTNMPDFQRYLRFHFEKDLRKSEF